MASYLRWGLHGFVVVMRRQEGRRDKCTLMDWRRRSRARAVRNMFGVQDRAKSVAATVDIRCGWCPGYRGESDSASCGSFNWLWEMKRAYSTAYVGRAAADYSVDYVQCGSRQNSKGLVRESIRRVIC